MAIHPQGTWGWMAGKLFRVSVPLRNAPGTTLPVGTIVRCVMASGMGDVGVTTRLDTERGYTHRAIPWQLEKVEDEEYGFESRIAPPFDKDTIFVECFEEDVVEWTSDVLLRSYWDG